MASSLRETHELRWGSKPPTSIHGFPGGKRPGGPPKSNVEKTSQWVGSLSGALLIEASATRAFPSQAVYAWSVFVPMSTVSKYRAFVMTSFVFRHWSFFVKQTVLALCLEACFLSDPLTQVIGQVSLSRRCVTEVHHIQVPVGAFLNFEMLFVRVVAPKRRLMIWVCEACSGT
jgi:hypothetical protein